MPLAYAGSPPPHMAMAAAKVSGQKDKLVKPIRSAQMVKALRNAGNTQLKYVTYSQLGHLCWDQAFSTPGIFHWLFSQKKDQ